MSFFKSICSTLAIQLLRQAQYKYHVLSGEIALRIRDILKGICAEKGLKIVKGNVRSNASTGSAQVIIHMLIESPSHYSPAKIAQYLKGKSSYQLQKEFPQLRKKYWGQHLWGRGYFCATVGAVTEAML